MNLAALAIIMAGVVAIAAMLRPRSNTGRQARANSGVCAVVGIFAALFFMGLFASLMLPAMRRAPSATRGTSATVEIDRSYPVPSETGSSEGVTPAEARLRVEANSTSVKISDSVPDRNNGYEPPSKVVYETTHYGNSDEPVVPVELRPWIGYGGLAVLIGLTYLFLDARRHRRYAVGLRIGYAVLFIGICFCLWELGPLTSN